jgi:PAS domain S-box-containing protein
VRGNATYLTNKDGENIGYIIVTVDLTEVVEGQKKAEEQRILLATIFSSSPDLIWYQDLQGRYLAVNPRFAALAGKAAEELVGLRVDDILEGEAAVRFKANDAQAMADLKPLYTEERLIFADNHEETLDSVRTPIFDIHGIPVGLLGFARDVSGRVIIENELRNTHLKLEKAVLDANQANQHKGDFLARMSHEIRTPMNAIIGMTGIVKKKLEEKEADPEELQANLRQIETSSQHLLGLLNDILDISKIEAGKIELSEETVDLVKLAHTVEVIIGPRCEEKNIIFDTHFELPPPSTFITDPLRLRQVLINLLGNAVKFTPECGRIEFGIVRKDQREDKVLMEFFIRDNGIGISREALDTLFKPFEQANNQISKRYGGTGLGLAISRSIVQLFGGDIIVESEEKKGSSFSFNIWLTMTTPKNEENILMEDAKDTLVGKRALLVDDVQINRIIAINLLEFTGITMDEADDGFMAVKLFRESPEYTYDIIYMDVQMPNMDGYEASLAIRSMDRADAKTVPIVALTANAFKEDIDKALACGMNAHLAKPMEGDKFLETTFNLIRRDEQGRPHRNHRSFP